ncbi:uncharacterized protein LOC131065971 [Cryptomeria japonica]|uniref:uncharacterized protein LOC131065971 n=1 Tax=Cryptomeria japonica TaxID=3369 RepID=UPI0027DA4B56|nr:uncharacterized protein LOC131065971 [Cryptomeria japonica]
MGATGSGGRGLQAAAGGEMGGHKQRGPRTTGGGGWGDGGPQAAGAIGECRGPGTGGAGAKVSEKTCGGRQGVRGPRSSRAVWWQGAPRGGQGAALWWLSGVSPIARWRRPEVSRGRGAGRFLAGAREEAGYWRRGGRGAGKDLRWPAWGAGPDVLQGRVVAGGPVYCGVVVFRPFEHDGEGAALWWLGGVSPIAGRRRSEVSGGRGAGRFLAGAREEAGDCRRRWAGRVVAGELGAAGNRGRGLQAAVGREMGGGGGAGIGGAGAELLEKTCGGRHGVRGARKPGSSVLVARRCLPDSWAVTTRGERRPGCREVSDGGQGGGRGLQAMVGQSSSGRGVAGGEMGGRRRRGPLENVGGRGLEAQRPRCWKRPAVAGMGCGARGPAGPCGGRGPCPEVSGGRGARRFPMGAREEAGGCRRRCAGQAAGGELGAAGSGGRGLQVAVGREMGGRRRMQGAEDRRRGGRGARKDLRWPAGGAGPEVLQGRVVAGGPTVPCGRIA